MKQTPPEPPNSLRVRKDAASKAARIVHISSSPIHDQLGLLDPFLIALREVLPAASSATRA